MRKKNVLRRFIILLAVLVPLAVATVRVMPAYAQSCPSAGATCIVPNQLADALQYIYDTTIVPALQQASSEIIAYMIPQVVNFDNGMYPILDWTKTELYSFFDTYWYYNMQPAMQIAVTEINTALGEQAFALGAFADAANAIRARRILDNMQINDHRALRPNGEVCMAGTMMGGMMRATAFSDGFNAASAASKLWRSANNFDAPSHAGTAADLNWRWTQFVSNWCNADYNGGHAGCNKTQANAGQDVDVAGLIFGEDTLPLTPLSQIPPPPGSPAGTTPTTSAPVYNNIQEMVTNLAEPFAKDPVTADPAHGGKFAILQSVSYKTKRQVAYDGIDYVISRRVPGGLNYTSQKADYVGASYPPPNPNGTPPTYDYAYFLWQIRALTGEEGLVPVDSMNDIGQQPPLLGSNFTSPNPSRNEVLRALMTQRYRSGKYSLEQIDDPENNRRQMVIDQALQLIQMSDQLDLMDHEMLLLASQVSTEVEQEHGFTTVSEGAPFK